MHAVFPHFPWCFFPSGEQYLANSTASSFPAGGGGEIGEDWTDDSAVVLRNEHRYRLQLGYVDWFIGQILDRLRSIGELDRCLLIVTADHGVSFQAGHSRRLLDAVNLPDILSVPLFIKLPHQMEGRVDDRNVESVDILPTVAEVLGIQLPEPVDGIPISSEKRRPRKTFYFRDKMTVIEPNVPQRVSAVQRQSALFGNVELEQLPQQAAHHPDWHGRSVDSFKIDQRTVPFVPSNPLDPSLTQEDLANAILVRTFVTGTLRSSDLPETPAELVVAVDGVIRDTGRSFWLAAREQGFEFLLPRSAVSTSPGRIQLYLVDRSKNRLQLRPLDPISAKR